MIENYLDPPQPVEPKQCDQCGLMSRSQVYMLMQYRDNVERAWFFDRLACVRKWSKGAR